MADMFHSEGWGEGRSEWSIPFVSSSDTVRRSRLVREWGQVPAMTCVALLAIIAILSATRLMEGLFSVSLKYIRARLLLRHHCSGVVHDEHAPHIELDAMAGVATPQANGAEYRVC
ncbi:MAG: hypothetical protein A2143_09035 [Gallionellales bacterium RBG_16_57_15]|nr:MAG: hypothetical protein A2143_09035 [Gallionellales bacterium RBG_16_57_15]